ncbi:MAG: hypothetical protein E6P95_01445 [Candidatus Moraniibacteriota bacterium]|nr:MAG: hypothetical protein E6P95_01445 [Candidatus Moranbacteria bacterium]
MITIGVSALVYALIKNRPRNNFLFKVNNRDVELALKVGSIEKINSAYIVPVNSEFDMNLNGSVKVATSVKSMVIKKFFAGDSSLIQKRINQELRSKVYTTQKDGGKYKIGTTVRIETEDRKNVFYFVVNSHKLNDKRVEASEDSLAITLSGLWSYISTHGAKEHIAIPLLGTGNGRLKIPREEVYKEIVRSFIASCSGKSYCEKLTIVIRDEDVSKCKINIEELVEFTKLQTEYADFRENTRPSAINSIE